MKHAPQLRDVRLQGVRGGLRRVLSPQLVDQAIGGYDLVGPDEQERQQGSPFGSSERKWPTVGPHFEWSENRELQHRISTLRVRGDRCEARRDRQGPSEEYCGGGASHAHSRRDEPEQRRRMGE